MWVPCLEVCSRRAWQEGPLLPRLLVAPQPSLPLGSGSGAALSPLARLCPFMPGSRPPLASVPLLACRVGLTLYPGCRRPQTRTMQRMGLAHPLCALDLDTSLSKRPGEVVPTVEMASRLFKASSVYCHFCIASVISSLLPLVRE